MHTTSPYCGGVTLAVIIRNSGKSRELADVIKRANYSFDLVRGYQLADHFQDHFHYPHSFLKN